MTMDLGTAVLIDGLTLVVCVTLLAVRGQFTHKSPATIYLLFHIFVISPRAWALHGGAPRLLPLSDSGFARAVIVADVALVVMTAAWVLKTPERWDRTPPEPKMLRPSIVWGVFALAMPVGIFFMATRSATSGFGGSEFTTSYQLIALNWPGLVLLAGIYVSGFRWYLVLPLLSYLTFMALQGSDRFRVVIPAILLMQIYLERKGRRLPDARVALVAALLLIAFIPMDALGKSYAEGTLSVDTLSSSWSQGLGDVTEGRSSDQAVFDQYATTLYLSDQLGRPQYGRHYVDLLALPVPRPWWPDKPATNEHLLAISSESLPLARIGAVFTLSGELYTDWRWFGIVIGGFLVARLLLRALRRADAYPYGSLVHFAYLLLSAAMIQIYRDGLSTLPIFLIVQNAPLMLMIALCWFFRPGHRDQTQRAQVSPGVTV